MGAANSAGRPPPNSPSVVTPKPPLVTADHPLHALVHATPSPPTDPDTSFYNVLFSDFLSIYHSTPHPLTSLIHQALQEPKSAHAAALSASLRAAIYHIRQPSLSQLQHGALYFALSVLEDLRAYAPSPVAGYLAIAAGPAEAQLLPEDRIDLARSLRSHLVTAVLDLILSLPVLSTSNATELLSVSLPLLLHALAEEDFHAPSSSTSQTPQEHSEKSNVTTPLLTYYSEAPRVILALLDIIALGAPHTQPSVQLATDIDHPSSTTLQPTKHNITNTSSQFHTTNSPKTASSTTNISNSPFIPSASSVWDAWDALATSAVTAASNAQTGIVDVLSTFSSSNGFKRATPSAPSSISDISQPPPIQSSSSPALHDNTNTLERETAVGNTDKVQHDNERYVVKESTFTGLPVLAPKEGSSFSHDNSMHDLEDNDNVPPETRVELGEQALALLGLFCHPLKENKISNILCALRDTNELASPPSTPKSSLSETIANGDETNETTHYSYSRLYDILGRWLPSPRGGLISYELLVRNKMFRTYALARTDPEVILVPLLASLRARCVVGGVPADVRIITSILLALSEDKGFCEAIDSVSIPSSWVRWILPDQQPPQQRIVRGLLQLGMADDRNGKIGSRVVNDDRGIGNGSTNARVSGRLGNRHASGGDGVQLRGKDSGRLDDGSSIMVSNAVLAVCARAVHQSLVGKRKGADVYVASGCLGVMGNIASEVTRVDRVVAERVVGLVEFLGRRRKRSIVGKDSEKLTEQIGELTGMSLEVVIGLLTNRSSVAVNVHVVYSVMHRESAMVSQDVAGCSMRTQALTHMIGRMVKFFSESVISADGQPVNVEKVLSVIEKKARRLHRDVFDGIPVATYRFEEGSAQRRHQRLNRYAQSLVLRNVYPKWTVIHADGNDNDPLRSSR